MVNSSSMRHRILAKYAPFAVVVLGIAFFLAIIFNNQGVILKVPSRDGVILTDDPNRISVGSPVRLRIPKISIDAAVQYVGLTKDGSMGTPKKPDDVAWFEPGTRPGEAGSAVIAGHYGWMDNKAAAFDELYKLRRGDKLYIEDDKGNIITFVVRESRRYDQQADASDVFSSNDGKSHLNLITCEGDWNKDQQSYSKRLVVFTDREI